jgi:hypothetical protein
MGVTVTRNFGPLTDVQLLTVEDWGRVGRMARERIVLRTRAGRDKDDVPFAPYSQGYAQAKAKELGAGPVNLAVSGDMLNAITVEPDANGVTLSFTR